MQISRLVQFGSSWNKLVKLLIRSRNSGELTVRSLLLTLPTLLTPILGTVVNMAP